MAAELLLLTSRNMEQRPFPRLNPGVGNDYPMRKEIPLKEQGDAPIGVDRQAKKKITEIPPKG